MPKYSKDQYYQVNKISMRDLRFCADNARIHIKGGRFFNKRSKNTSIDIAVASWYEHADDEQLTVSDACELITRQVGTHKSLIEAMQMGRWQNDSPFTDTYRNFIALMNAHGYPLKVFGELVDYQIRMGKPLEIVNIELKQSPKLTV